LKRFIFSLFFPLILFIFIELKKNCSKTEGFTGADLENLCREAALLALRRDWNAIVVFKILIII